jgi:hypothetical protein
MIKYFMMLLCYVLSKIKKITNKSKLSSNNNGQESNLIEYYGLCMVLIFIYKFINFIIEQCESIMTTLEHLKYYFLFNINNIDSYNEKLFNGVGRQFICNKTKIPKSNLGVDIAPSKTKLESASTNHTDTYSNCDNLLYLGDNAARYTYNTKIGETLLTETVIMGGMFEYGLMSILQKLNGREPDLSKLQVKAGSSGSYLDLASDTKKDEGAGAATAAAEPGATKAMFVMFANINAQVSQADAEREYNPSILENIKLICNDDADTLDFAQSVSSTSAGQVSNAPGAGSEAEGAAAAFGGAIKHYRDRDRDRDRDRAKKYLTSRRRKHTLKQLSISQPNSIYSRKSRKYKS